MTIIEMRQKRAGLWEQMKALDARAKEEKRDLTAEERQQWDALNAEVDALKERIDREERAQQLEAEMAAAAAQAREGDGGDGEPASPTATAEYREAFRAYLRGGMVELDPAQRQLLRRGAQTLDGKQVRQLGVGVGPLGGFTVPDEAMRPIVDAMAAVGGVRRARITRITTETGGDLPIPMSDDTTNEGERIGEHQEVPEDDVLVGQKVLRAYMYTSRVIRVSYQFLQDTSIDSFEAWLGGVLGRRIGRRENRDLTDGLGGGAEPEGLLQASILGATSAAAGVIGYEDLVELEHSVDPEYRQGAEWMMHDQTLKELKQLVDGMGRPLWVPGVAVREPDTILGYRYVINQHFPSPVWGAGDRAIAFGDMSYYWLREVRGFMLIRLEEMYARNLQVGFLGIARADGALVDAGTHPIRHLAMA